MSVAFFYRGLFSAIIAENVRASEARQFAERGRDLHQPHSASGEAKTASKSDDESDAFTHSDQCFRFLR